MTRGGAWDFAEIARGNRPATGAEPTNLVLADLDNNGALDIVAGDQVFLGDGRGFAPLPGKTASQLPNGRRSQSGWPAGWNRTVDHVAQAPFNCATAAPRTTNGR